jgi:Zn-dependent protease with chaperone function
LLARLEAVERRSPGRFVNRVAAMAILGYTVLILVLAVFLAVVAGVIILVMRAPNAGTVKIALIVGITALWSAWSVLRSLWVRLDPPVGMVLKPKEAPALFAELKRLRRLLRVGRIAKVFLTPDLNAAACEVPRFGVFGWARRYLVLGLPLLQGLSPDELRSVIAHEIGHLSKEHNGITRWLYRIRLTWLNLVSSASDQGRGFFVLGPFLRWWWPRFNAHAFVLSRRQEYEADGSAARAGGAEVAGQALLRLTVMSRFLEEEFWPEIQKLAVGSATPPSDLHERLAQSLRQDPGTEAPRWLREGLAVPTNNADTHPCLRDRLVQMGFPGAESPDQLVVPPVPERTAAAEFLGPLEQRAAERFSAEWVVQIRDAWKQRHEEANQRREALEKTEAAEAAGILTLEQRWERISHVADVEGYEAVVPLVRELLEMEPTHAAGNFLYGRILLDQDDAAGMDHLERAMKRDIFATPDACGLIHAYLQRKGRLAEAKALERRVYEHEQLLEQAQQERTKVNHRTPLRPHGLDAGAQDAIREVLMKHPEIARASIVQAEVKLLPDHPYFLVAITVKVPWWKLRGDEADQRLVNTLVGTLPVPGQFFIFISKGWAVAALAKAIGKVAGSQIYERERRRGRDTPVNPA